MGTIRIGGTEASSFESPTLKLKDPGFTTLSKIGKKITSKLNRLYHVIFQRGEWMDNKKVAELKKEFTKLNGAIDKFKERVEKHKEQYLNEKITYDPHKDIKYVKTVFAKEIAGMKVVCEEFKKRKVEDGGIDDLLDKLERDLNYDLDAAEEEFKRRSSSIKIPPALREPQPQPEPQPAPARRDSLPGGTRIGPEPQPQPAPTKASTSTTSTTTHAKPKPEPQPAPRRDSLSGPAPQPKPEPQPTRTVEPSVKISSQEALQNDRAGLKNLRDQKFVQQVNDAKTEADLRTVEKRMQDAIHATSNLLKTDVVKGELQDLNDQLNKALSERRGELESAAKPVKPEGKVTPPPSPTRRAQEERIVEKALAEIREFLKPEEISLKECANIMSIIETARKANDRIGNKSIQDSNLKQIENFEMEVESIETTFVLNFRERLNQVFSSKNEVTKDFFEKEVEDVQRDLDNQGLMNWNPATEQGQKALTGLFTMLSDVDTVRRNRKFVEEEELMQPLDLSMPQAPPPEPRKLGLKDRAGIHKSAQEKKAKLKDAKNALRAEARKIGKEVRAERADRSQEDQWPDLMQKSGEKVISAAKREQEGRQLWLSAVRNLVALSKPLGLERALGIVKGSNSEENRKLALLLDPTKRLTEKERHDLLDLIKKGLTQIGSGMLFFQTAVVEEMAGDEDYDFSYTNQDNEIRYYGFKDQYLKNAYERAVDALSQFDVIQTQANAHQLVSQFEKGSLKSVKTKEKEPVERATYTSDIEKMEHKEHKMTKIQRSRPKLSAGKAQRSRSKPPEFSSEEAGKKVAGYEEAIRKPVIGRVPLGRVPIGMSSSEIEHFDKLENDYILKFAQLDEIFKNLIREADKDHQLTNVVEGGEEAHRLMLLKEGKLEAGLDEKGINGKVEDKIGFIESLLERSGQLIKRGNSFELKDENLKTIYDRFNRLFTDINNIEQEYQEFALEEEMPEGFEPFISKETRAVEVEPKSQRAAQPAKELKLSGSLAEGIAKKAAKHKSKEEKFESRLDKEAQALREKEELQRRRENSIFALTRSLHYLVSVAGTENFKNSFIDKEVQAKFNDLLRKAEKNGLSSKESKDFYRLIQQGLRDMKKPQVVQQVKPEHADIYLDDKPYAFTEEGNRIGTPYAEVVKGIKAYEKLESEYNEKFKTKAK